MSNEELIQQLSFIEQNLSSVVNQKQSYHKQILEMQSALKELENSESAYEIVGTIMIKKSAKDIISSITEKIKTQEIRMKSLEKQEETLRNQAQEIQSKVMTSLENKNKE